MLSSIFHTHFYENGYSTVFLDYKFCFFSSETCCDFQGDLYKAIKVKRKAGTLGLVTNEKSQVSLYCAFSSNHAASFSFALNI